jgi:hypothetical protein
MIVGIYFQDGSSGKGCSKQPLCASKIISRQVRHVAIFGSRAGESGMFQTESPVVSGAHDR